MFVFRTRTGKDIGIGHLVRVSHIAKQLQENGYKVLFVLDEKDDRVLPFIKNYQLLYLYNKQNIFNENIDAELTLDILKNYSVEYVIVDSYDINISWEDKLKRHGYKLLVLDDIQREHNCDIIVDQKWDGPENTFIRYENKVPQNCLRLLGPKYSLLSNKYIKTDGYSPFSLMFSLGGGGDISIFNEIIYMLLSKTSLDISIVIGPLSYNYEYILRLSDEYHNLTIIQNSDSLYEYYMTTSLFIGALGTSLYELSILKIPSLTFSIAKNQTNNINSLENLGHHLHIDINELKNSQKIYELINTLTQNLKRLKRLKNESILTIDAYGVKRVCNILTKDSKQLDTEYKLNTKQHNKINLSKNITIRKVIDSDINHYLYSRNLQQNLNNFNIQTKVSKADHYNWWFNNNRNSYLLEKNDKKHLYIWDQKVNFKEKYFFIGGWFICDNNTTFDLAAAALQWQLEMTKKENPDVTWIAIIKKTNDYVNTLNKYMGFIEVDKNSIEFEAIKKYFNNPSVEEYNYVKKSV